MWNGAGEASEPTWTVAVGGTGVGVAEGDGVLVGVGRI